MGQPWCVSLDSAGEHSRFSGEHSSARHTAALAHQYVHHSRIASACFCSKAL